MTTTDYVICLTVLYLALAVLIGKFCGFNQTRGDDDDEQVRSGDE